MFTAKTPYAKRAMMGRIVGALTGLAISYGFDFMIIGYLLTIWGISALGKELMTWGVNLSDEDIRSQEMTNPFERS